MDLDEHASNWQRLGRRALREPFGWVFICRAFLYAGVSQYPPVELLREYHIPDGPFVSLSSLHLRWRLPACPRVFSFAPTLPVSGRGGRALNLGNKAAEDP